MTLRATLSEKDNKSYTSASAKFLETFLHDRQTDLAADLAKSSSRRRLDSSAARGTKYEARQHRSHAARTDSGLPAGQQARPLKVEVPTWLLDLVEASRSTVLGQVIPLASGDTRYS